METTETITAASPLELTKAPRKAPALDLRDIPQAPGPEKGVLALMAMDPATYVGQCVTIGMTEDYFYLPAHKLLWRLFQTRYNKNEPIDIVSITQALEDMHQLEAVGGSAGLAEIYTFTTTGAYFEHYLNVLKDKFILRSIIDIATRSTTQAFDNPDDVAELLDSVETHIFQIRERYNSAKDEQSLASILKQAVTNFEKFIASKGQIQGLTTGFEELDKKSNGLKPGDMFIIAARPSMGKTSFLLNIVEHIALNEKKPTLLFSCEMPAVQIVERLLFARSGVRSREIIKRGNLTQLEMKHFKQAVKEVGASQLVIDDTAAISINELRAKARRVMRDQGGLAAIGVDYLQLMRGSKRTDSREQEISEISRSLKGLAKEMDIPVVALSQLNRKLEERTDKRPLLSDLRESGAIEQDADVIMFIYRDEVYHKQPDNPHKGSAEIIIGKQRNGPIGTATLAYLGSYTAFEDLEPGLSPQPSEAGGE